MIPENVTLIVKAPNQQIEDQNIQCQSSWTVKQLKGHLSDVYPNKPRTEEQKIIYSGQLLEDSTILKDVLRTYDNQMTHTMHLVCTPSRKVLEPLRVADVAPDGLRRRNEPEVVPRAETSQNQQNHTMEMQNYLNTAMNNYGRVPPYPAYGMGQQMPAQDTASLTNQMMMMQQAYMQYMQQYALWQASYRGEPVPAAAPAPPPEPPAEDEEPHRDWLDHLYAASRLAILSSLIYLYGSGTRLLLVIIIAAAGYLHQMGFFRDLNLNRPYQPAGNQNQPAGGNAPAGNGNQPNANGNQPNANGNQPNVNGNQRNANGNQPNANGNQPNANGNQPNVNGNQRNVNGNQPNVNGNQPNPNRNQPETEQEGDDPRSLWAFSWMVFTTFFSSLIPDAN